jgi:hypothetical protein
MYYPMAQLLRFSIYSSGIRSEEIYSHFLPMQQGKQNHGLRLSMRLAHQKVNLSSTFSLMLDLSFIENLGYYRYTS